MPLGDLGLTGVIGGLLQDKPKIPPFVPVSGQAEQAKAISGNLAQLPTLENLTGQINTFLSGQQAKQTEALSPGYAAARAQELGVAQSEMAGELPGFNDWIKRTAAETATATGSDLGSSFSFGQEANIGFQAKSQLIQSGLAATDRWIAEAQKPQSFDFTSMFVTPQQQIGLATEERNAQFQVGMVNAQNDAAHSFSTIVGQSLIQSDQQMNQALSSL